jgi:hypothetical protein
MRAPHRPSEEGPVTVHATLADSITWGGWTWTSGYITWA